MQVTRGHLKRIPLLLLVVVSLGLASTSEAALQFENPPAGMTLYPVPLTQLNVTNPQYTAPNIPNVGNVTVSFGTLFQGQSYGSEHNSLSDTTPTNPLTLDYSKGSAVTLYDFARKSVVLGSKIGNTLFTAPLAVHFSQNVSNVLFDLGSLDKNSPTLVEAFTRTGASLGFLGGFGAGFNSVALADSSGSNAIAGLSIYVPDHTMDWEGFGLSNIRFGVNDGGEPQVPEPSALLVWSVLGLVGGAGVCWTKKWNQRS